MRTSLIKISALFLVMTGSFAMAQENSMREYLAPQKYQRNVFEDPKVAAPEYDGVKVSIGGDFAAQFQALEHSTTNNLGNYTVVTTSTGAGPVVNTVVTKPNALRPLGKDINLPTANLDVNAYLAKGVKLHLRTYLSARHHNEAWVKGGYLQIDNLDFIKEGLLSDVMDNVRFKAGYDDVNYGDAHFRRTDNAYALGNAFVGNNIMDSFLTEPFIEAYGFMDNGLFVMGGITNGKLNQSVVNTPTTDNAPTIYGKVGFDKQVQTDLRVRLTGSVIKTNGLSTGSYIYGADRAGSRYYYVLTTEADAVGTSSQSTGRFNPGFRENLAFQINPFVKYQGLEFFGTFENVSGYKLVSGKKADSKGNYTQLAAELLYRFGSKEQFYLGGKYNNVSGKDMDGAAERSVDRFNIAGGWYMTPNILTKVEYVNQKYDESAAWGATSALKGGKFNGLMIEATIGF